MALEKVNYIYKTTNITPKNMNNIQDEIIKNTKNINNSKLQIDNIVEKKKLIDDMMNYIIDLGVSVNI